MQRLVTLFTLFLMLAPGAVLAQSTTFVINEIDYDQPGNDSTEFIELYNVSEEDLSLAGYQLELVDGTSAGGADIYRTIDLNEETVPAGGFFVVCSREQFLTRCDQDILPRAETENNFIRNGRFDAIGLRGPSGDLVDAVSYEGDVEGYTEGGSVSPGDRDDVVDYTIARVPDGVDTNDNDSDFDAGAATPGFDNEFVPVEFAGFTAQADGEAVVLQWTTASEESNAGFQVQRRTAAGAFANVEDAFIETKAPGGTSTEALDYRFRVENLAAGTHAFRLKQVDYDQTFDYSPTVEVTVAPRMRISEVHPNPFRSQARFEMSVPTAQEVTVEVYNILGQRVALLHDGPVAAGETLRPTLEAGGLASGLYLVRVQGETFSEVRRATLVK